MDGNNLDEVDRGLLHLLQQDARNPTAADLAEQLPVSEGTVRNRLAKLEDRGVIEGYTTVINYELAGYPLKIVFSCEASIIDQSEIARQALQVTGVVRVSELLTGRENIRVLAIAEDMDDIATIAQRLTEVGLDVQVQELVQRERVRPFNHFGGSAVAPAE